MPSNPSDATDSPITPPPKNAIRKAGPGPCARAASDVRTLARVAAVIPKKPARIEHAAPATYAIAVFLPTAMLNRMATTTMNGTSTEYSRLKNALAPLWICAARSRMVSFPSGCRFKYM